ncbi:hypothetical protein K440DRAFT_617785 [Wilcoxina mikolae CBS 423.85]|nr:hypothetical protein K440DRAFT_617785 [Wilcoxina mikolae CBS 423.85]
MEPILPSPMPFTLASRQPDFSAIVSGDASISQSTVLPPESTLTRSKSTNSGPVLTDNLTASKDSLEPQAPLGPLPPNSSLPSARASLNTSLGDASQPPPSPPPVSPPPTDSTPRQAPTNLLLTPPPLRLRDRNNKLNLIFNTCIHLTTPLSENWRTLLLLHTHSFHLTITLTYNRHPISGNSLLGESFAHLLSTLPMWAQLDFSTSLSIFAEKIQITLLRSTSASVEFLLPSLLPTARIPEIKLDFAFEGRGKVRVGMLAPLVDVAVRSFWGDKVARMAPFLGRVGFARECEERREYVEVVSGVLGKFLPVGGEVKALVWRVVLKNLVTRGSLEGVDLEGVEKEMGEEFDPKEGVGEVEMLDFEVEMKRDEWESEGFGECGFSNDDMLLGDDEDRECADDDFCDEWSSDEGLISSDDGEDELWAALETGDDEIWEALEKTSTKEDSDEDVFESYEWDEMMGMAW